MRRRRRRNVTSSRVLRCWPCWMPSSVQRRILSTDSVTRETGQTRGQNTQLRTAADTVHRPRIPDRLGVRTHSSVQRRILSIDSVTRETGQTRGQHTQLRTAADTVYRLCYHGNQTDSGSEVEHTAPYSGGYCPPTLLPGNRTDSGSEHTAPYSGGYCPPTLLPWKPVRLGVRNRTHSSVQRLILSERPPTLLPWKHYRLGPRGQNTKP